MTDNTPNELEGLPESTQKAAEELKDMVSGTTVQGLGIKVEKRDDEDPDTAGPPELPGT